MSYVVCLAFTAFWLTWMTIKYDGPQFIAIMAICVAMFSAACALREHQPPKRNHQ